MRTAEGAPAYLTILHLCDEQKWLVCSLHSRGSAVWGVVDSVARQSAQLNLQADTPEELPYSPLAFAVETTLSNCCSLPEVRR